MMKSAMTMKNGTLGIAALVAAGLLVWSSAPQFATSALSKAAVAYPGANESVDQSTFEYICIRADLSAATMSSAGLSITDVASVLSDVDSWAAANIVKLESADGQVASAIATVACLRREIRRGKTENGASELSQALASQQSAEQSRDLLLDKLHASYANRLSDVQAKALKTIRQNHKWCVSADLRAASGITESDWLALERCDRLDEDDVSDSDIKISTAINRRTEVLTSKSNRSVREDSLKGEIASFKNRR